MQIIPELGKSIPDDWVLSTLGARSSKIGSGATPKGGSSVYVQKGTALIRSQNVYDHEFKDEGLAFIDDSAAHALRGVTVQEGDVLINITGDSILRTTVVPPRVLPARVNQHVAIVRPDDSLCSAFVQKWLATPQMKDYMLGLSSGATRKAITKGHLSSLPIPIPPLGEQRAIAVTLGALDDKIESNREVISLIPQLIHALVEQAVEENGAIEVPVSSLGKFVNGGAYTKGASGSGRMVIRIAELNSGPGASTVYNEIDVPEERTAHPGDILMSWSGSLGVYVWYRPEAIVNQHIFKVIPGDFSHWFVFDRLTSVIDIFRAIAADKATTMGHIQRRHLNSTPVEIPDHGLTELSATCGPLWDRRNKLLQESLHLEQLRDTLLPELMSGRIRVLEAREVIDQEVGL